MNYRYDKRSEEQFKDDIKNCTIFEKELANLYLSWLNSRLNSKFYSLIDNGIDNSGNFISNDKLITAEADFILRADGQADRRIEIKHCKPERSIFHLKVNHIKKCIEDDVCIINWMNTDGPNRRFCILTPNILKIKLEQGPKVKMWYKECIRFFNKDHEWINI